MFATPPPIKIKLVEDFDDSDGAHEQTIQNMTMELDGLLMGDQELEYCENETLEYYPKDWIPCHPTLCHDFTDDDDDTVLSPQMDAFFVDVMMVTSTTKNAGKVPSPLIRPFFQTEPSYIIGNIASSGNEFANLLQQLANPTVVSSVDSHVLDRTPFPALPTNIEWINRMPTAHPVSHNEYCTLSRTLRFEDHTDYTSSHGVTLTASVLKLIDEIANEGSCMSSEAISNRVCAGSTTASNLSDNLNPVMRKITQPVAVECKVASSSDDAPTHATENSIGKRKSNPSTCDSGRCLQPAKRSRKSTEQSSGIAKQPAGKENTAAARRRKARIGPFAYLPIPSLAAATSSAAYHCQMQNQLWNGDYKIFGKPKKWTRSARNAN